MLTLPWDDDNVLNGGFKATSLVSRAKACPAVSTKLDGKGCNRYAGSLPRLTRRCGVAMKAAALDNDTTPVAVLLTTPAAAAAAAATAATALL